MKIMPHLRAGRFWRRHTHSRVATFLPRYMTYHHASMPIYTHAWPLLSGKTVAFARHVATSLVVATSFVYLGFGLPAIAVESLVIIEDVPVAAVNGAPLTSEEQELLAKDHIIIEAEEENEVVATNGDTSITITPVDRNTLAPAVPLQVAVAEVALPAAKDIAIIDIGIHSLTAYNSDPGQTDDSPCITANGFNVCNHGIEDTVAANFLDFGTKIRIPDLFGDRIFVVRDRMNARYQSRIDIWMLNRSDAVQFGVQKARIEVLNDQ